MVMQWTVNPPAKSHAWFDSKILHQEPALGPFDSTVRTKVQVSVVYL